jgi:hypothetical protein
VRELAPPAGGGEARGGVDLEDALATKVAVERAQTRGLAVDRRRRRRRLAVALRESG